jgi:glutathione S-transferase
LGYWAIRGLAQQLRYILEYVGATYEEKRYPEVNDDWFSKDKP